MRLTPLETMFVEEFCRFADVPSSEVRKLRACDRERNPVGFLTAVEPSSVPRALQWDHRVFNPARIAVVGPEKTHCGMLLFFNRETGLLDGIEGFVYGERWPDSEEPAYWSEGERAEIFRSNLT